MHIFWRNASAVLIVLSTISHTQAERPVRIVGSSAVYGFVTMVAERIGKTTDFRSPIVENTGTGGGIKLFCAGKGKNHPDAVNTSRPMTDDEKRICEEHGVDDVLEFKIGYDGIVIGGNPSQKPFPLTRVDLSKALAEQIETSKGLAPNPYKRWDEVNPDLPSQKIMVLGPTSTLAARELFEKKVIKEGCEAWTKDKSKCRGDIREDGPFVEISENESVIIQRMDLHPEALGFVSYGYFVQNPSRIRPLSIDGLFPNVETISNGTYVLTRPLYIYVKDQQMEKNPALKAVLQEMLSERASGAHGYLLEKGLIPLKPEEWAAEKEKVK